MDDPTLRKIELENVEDLRYLYNKLLDTARSKIDIHLPPPPAPAAPQAPSAESTSTSATTATPPPSDPLRDRVQTLLQSHLNKTFTLALPNLSINGLTPAPSTPLSTLLAPPVPETEYEPYDRALHTKVQDLYAQIEAQTLKVAKLRKEVPARAVRRWEKAMEREEEEDERVIRAILEEGEGKRREAVGEMEGVGRGAEVDLEEWKRGMEVLEGLKTTLPSTTHKLTRAQDALDYLRSKQEP